VILLSSFSIGRFLDIFSHNMKANVTLSIAFVTLLSSNNLLADPTPISEAMAFRATCEAFEDSPPSQDPLVSEFLTQFCSATPSGAPLDTKPVEIAVGQLNGVGEIEEICNRYPQLLAIRERTPCGKERLTQKHLNDGERAKQSDQESIKALAKLQQAIGYFNISQTRQFLQSLGKREDQIEFGVMAVEVMHRMLQASLEKLLKQEMTWGEFNRQRLYTRNLADMTINAVANTPSNQ